MSSLRLALKQSLEESAGPGLGEAGAASASGEHNNNNNSNNGAEQDDGTNRDNDDNNNSAGAGEHRSHAGHSQQQQQQHQGHRGPGRPRKHHGDTARKRGRPRKQTKSDEEESDKEHEFHSDSEHPEKIKQKEAANKIQSHWKKNKQSSPGGDEKDSANPEEEPALAAAASEEASPAAKAGGAAAAAAAAAEESPSVSAKKKLDKNKKSRNKKGDEDTGYSSGKTKTVPAPGQEILEWMRNLPVKRARRNVAPGMRVKVRFATKVKREGKAIRKKKWFGGRVSAVSKEGSKIRIKYDDGTAEVTKFPDKDIVVDDTSNGQHQALVDKFLPPEPQSNDEEEEATFPKEDIATSTKARTQKAEPIVEKEPAAEMQPVEPSEPEGMAIDTPGNSKKAPTEKDVVEPSKPAAIQVKPASPTPEMKKAVLSPVPPQGSPKPKRKRGRPPKHRPVPVDKASAIETPPELTAKAATEQVEQQRPQATIVSHKEPAPVDTPEAASDPAAVPEDTTADVLANEADEAKPKLPSHAERDMSVAKPHSKLSLTIRIPSRKKEEQQSKPSASPGKSVDVADAEMPDAHVEEAQLGENVQRVKSPKSKKRDRIHDESGSAAVEPHSKRIHIHIPSTKTSETPLEAKSTAPAKSVEVQPEPPVSLSRDEAQTKSADTEATIAEADLVPDTAAAEPRAHGFPSTASAHLPKKMRQMNLEGGNKVAPERPASDSALLLPTASKSQNTDESAAAEGPVDAADSSANLTHSSNSAFDGKEPLPGVGVKAGDGKSLTPHDWSKEAAPVVRSGRRAAQQANERIVSRQEVIIQDPFAKKKRKKDKRKDGEGGNDSDASDDSQWVQCDSCSKWRTIPGSVVANLPKQWYCLNNLNDPKRSSCEAPEQTQKQYDKEKRKRKRQQVIQAAAAAAEAERGHPDGSNEANGEPIPREVPTGLVKVKPRRPSPVAQSVERDTVTEVPRKPEKKSSGLGKKGRSQESLQGLVAAAAESEPPPKPRGRGRPRRVRPSDNASGSGIPRQTDEAENLEWVQCEKCDKWRKLPPHVSAGELPDVWYCNMNTWNPSSASCGAAEDKADGLQDTGFGVSGSKLCYRNLIFGSNGRKANRPISERTRAAESLFAAPSDEDTPPSVMYANSSAFVSRPNKFSTVEETDEMTVLELMSHSNLWTELQGTAPQPSVVSSGGNPIKPQRRPFFSFGSLPSVKKEALKSLLLHSLDSKTLTADKVLLEVQGKPWENVPADWVELRPYCSIDVVVTALCELANEGRVDCVQSLGPNWTVKDWNPRYRCAKTTSSISGGPSEPPTPRESSRCMKIAKPWKRARIQ